MKNINNKATICTNQSCVTVFGETAVFINAIVVTTVIIIAVALIRKAFQ